MGGHVFPDPDIAEFDRVLVKLEADRLLGFVWAVGGRAVVIRVPFEFDMVLYQDAVEQNGQVSRFDDFPVSTEFRRVVDNVIGLPLSWFAARIDDRWGLFVDSAALPVKVGFILKRI